MTRRFSVALPLLGMLALPACAQPGGQTREGPIYYVSDCQEGAATGCVPGKNSNAGTSPTAPKQTLAGMNVNTLPAGSQVLFNRGGAWNWTSIVRVENRSASAAAPLTFGAYGSGPAPLLKVSSSFAFETGEWNNTTPDGGYVFRGLKFDGMLAVKGSKAIWLRGTVSDVLIDDVEFTGFYIGLYGQEMNDVQRITVRNSRFLRNSGMGVLGTFNNSLFEGNTFEGNNFSGSVFDHAIYLSNHENTTIRKNLFVNNSVVNGECRGGNLTVHGVVDRLTIEDNVIQQARSTPGCYGVSITSGYGTVAEVFRNVVVRKNVISNLGGCAICLNSAPKAVVEDNVIIQDTRNPHTAVQIRKPGGESTDDPGGGEVVRNNVACFTGSAGQTFSTGTSGATLSNNVVHTGADANAGACAAAKKR